MLRASSRLAPLVFAIALPLTAALILLPGEFSHYKRWLELGTDETTLRIAVISAILSKTVLALLPWIGMLVLCAFVAHARTLRCLSLTAGLLVLGFLEADLELQKNTGNNITHYLPFLLDPDTFVWAGTGFDLAPGLIRLGINLGIALVPASVAAWLLERWVARSPLRRGRGVLSISLGFLLLVLSAAPILQRNADAPGPLYHLSERMPWSWHAGMSTQFTAIGESQVEAQRLFARALPEFAPPPRFESLLVDGQPAITPDILVIAIESLRHDALDPETMPRLWASGEEGVRLENHYATSNASHYGMFSLLYGRSPLLYFETLDSGESPTLSSQMRRWGYTTHHITCSDIRWREMDRFMGSDDFDVERLEGSSLDACDRDVVSRVASLLEPGERAPRFVLTFLMSTHFGYHYPDGAEPFQPSAPPPNALELKPGRDATKLVNRYRNSAHYVDSLVGSLLDRIEGEDTLVIVTGDHGESLFDDGTIAHSSLLSEIQTRVPLVVIGPGVLPGSARPGPTDHSDLLPTILARMGVDGSRLEAYPGRDVLSGNGPAFVPLVHAKARRGGEDHIALASPEHRYAFRLDAESNEILFLGGLRPDGHPSHHSGSDREGAQAIRWLDQYLSTLTRH